MPSQPNLLLAHGDNDKLTAQAITETFTTAGYHVIHSEAVTAQDIAASVARAGADRGAIDALIYLSPPPVRGAVLDDGANVLIDRVHSDLEVGTLWLQATARSMINTGTHGRLTLIGHITAAVPTQRFSYSSASQLALMNLSRGAALELAPQGIRFNTILRGWDPNSPDQVDYVNELRTRNAGDGAPLLDFTTPEEIAKAALFLSDPLMTSLNGVLLTLDSGFQISRKIRQEGQLV